MYESPIKIMYGTAQSSIENDVFKAILSYDIQVDKDELIRALTYDRQQYEKGYAEGTADALEAKAAHMTWPWISVNDKLPKPFQQVLCCRNINVVESCCFMPDGRWRISGTYVKCVTHWMPLPEPPEVG